MPKAENEKVFEEAVKTKRVKKNVITLGAYDHAALEKKWQDYWHEKEVFKSPDLPEGEKVYILDMFPYPSAEGLHVGHPEGYTATDIMCRYLRMKGKTVLHPMGWDAFGLPAENYAIKTGTHPSVITQKNIDNFRAQIKSLGFSYDWSREVDTTDPKYYKWTQWIFLQLYKKGLAYQEESLTNWCPKDKTGLANEEVVAGKCDRCGTEVERRKIRQWMLKITAYADRLVEGLDNLDWPDSIKRLQTNWVGKKEGAKVNFQIRGTETYVDVFTTRIDTIFGVSFLVLAPEHPDLDSIVTPAQAQAVKEYTHHALNKSDLEREVQAVASKTGVFTGAYAINPINSEEIPVWVSDYVMASVGMGAIMGVPGHDARDYDFAKTFDLSIQPVVATERDYNLEEHPEPELPFEQEGVLIYSGSFSGMRSDEARKTLLGYLERRGEAEEMVSYKLRDWVFSRQRYWGEPIPLVHCESCGIVPVPESELPVVLPTVEKYEPTGTGESPLAGIEEWVNTTCPTCNQPAKRETNTMPQWAGSCWYYLRFIDPHNDAAPWSKDKEKAWMPVDVYVGGAEHAVLHLLYARFWHKVLYDEGHVSTDEPFHSLRNQGMILGPDNQKMSKSRGNVINPDGIIKEYGADTLRVYEMFMGPFEDTKPWSTQSMIGTHRFLRRIWDISSAILAGTMPARTSAEITEKLQVLINKVTSDIEAMKFNTAIASFMEFSHVLSENKEKISKKALSTYVTLLSPFAPHISEEIWAALGHADSIQLTEWPSYKEVKASKTFDMPVQINGKVRHVIKVGTDEDQASVLAKAMKSSKVKAYITDAANVKVVYVPGKILNLVVLASE